MDASLGVLGFLLVHGPYLAWRVVFSRVEQLFQDIRKGAL